MSAVKIIFKRSSIFGKRPTSSNLEAGEIGLNTNATDPGLFFEVNNGDVVKVGPTSYLKEAPTQAPSQGEMWVDRDTKTLNIGTDGSTWQKVAAPFLGGTGGLTVFVAPEYPNASDSLSNDGQSVPFVTINRAIIEVTKVIINDTVNGLSLGNNRYQIVLAPGQHCVVNTPGVSAYNFSVNFTNPNLEVTQDILRQFNPESVGGLVLPRGVSIIGMDLKKCEIHPTYVPKYTYPGFPTNYAQTQGGPIYTNQPLSSVFRWSGNTYLSNFVGLDKVENRLVVQVSQQSGTNFAVFRTNRPHGLDYNDFVQMTYSDVADQVGATFASGQYYVNPLNAFEFTVSALAFGSQGAQEILASALPPSYFTTNISSDPKFQVSNIYPYFIPLTNEEYELHSYSHHRLSLIKNASIQELNDYYVKVQKAFPVFFGGKVNTDLASPPEFDIVAPTLSAYPSNLATNSTDNSSPYQNQVNHRSDYGMANGDYDGEVVSGFKSVIINESTAVVLQKDPVAYEVYTTSSQNWTQLTAFTQQTLGSNRPITSIPTTPQLQNLNEAPIPNIRYYYETVKVLNPANQQLQSTGISDPNIDFRHFGFRISGSNSFMQAQNVYTIGAAIACWARAGALISLSSSTTNFGSVALQADGFSGIGTLGGANPVNKGFLLSGITRPLKLLEETVNADSQKRILFLGSKIVQVGIDPNDPAVQLIYLQRPFDPASILPFSLKPGTAIFTSDSICTFRAFFVTDGTPTCIPSGSVLQNPFSNGGAVLRVRLSDSTIPNRPATSLDIPYIRRFIDPRTSSEKCYGFYVQSSNPTSQAPQLGSVLRLNQTGQSLSNSLKRNFQFDPGLYGGISQVFTVDAIETEQYSVSPNFNYKVNDVSQATNYVVYASLTDASAPWVQSVTVNGVLEPFNTPQGTFLTYENKNFYAAENNLWTSLYFETTFNPLNGPTKVSPDDPVSPFVPTSVIERNEPIAESWQGYVPDPFYSYYTTEIPVPYNAQLSYLRGAVVPYSEIAPQFQVDDDDSSADLGIIFKRLPDDVRKTTLVADTKEVQTPIAMTTPFVTTPSFGRPSVIEFPLLSIQPIILPKEGVSVLELTNPAVNALEYVRVISVNSNIIRAIRNYYPEYAQGTLPAVWPKGTTAKVCVPSGEPEPSVYDPFWAVTKATMTRFFALMGYAPNLVAPYLQPQYFGERILPLNGLPLSPVNGYANLTTAWPIEFNNPSTIIANGHTWQYAGYFDYSRGLPKFQVNEISKKLSYDYQSTTSWGGRLTILGTNEAGQVVFSGPTTEALTAQYFVSESPFFNLADRQVYQSPDQITLPNPILVYAVDDISGQFDGSTTSFNLTRGGFGIPSDQLSDIGLFVFLGGVVQKPIIAYAVVKSPTGAFVPQITFSEPPPKGTSCDIRVVTSEDDEATLDIIDFKIDSPFNSIATSFGLSPGEPSLSNLNSFVFLGGVEQNPTGVNQTSGAYTVSQTLGATDLTFVGGAPADGTVFDMRGILSGYKYRQSGISTVFVSSVDDIAPLFDNSRTAFPLTINGAPVDPTLVNAQNMFVSLGGVMQIPVAQAGSPLAGLAYSVEVNPITKVLEIIFANPPQISTTCNVRIITSTEYLTCPVPESLQNTILEDGPGILVNENNQIIGIDPGLLTGGITPGPGFSIVPSTSTVTEGNTVTFTVQAPTTPDGTLLYWSTSQVSGVVTAADFSDNTLVGTVLITNGLGLINRTIALDLTTEGPESFKIELRTGSVTGPIAATSTAVTITETPPPPPPPPTYTISPSTNVVAEGGTVLFTIGTTNVPNGTNLYWSTKSVTGSVVGGDFTDGVISGVLTINSNASSVSRTIVSDLTIEGSESFQIELRTGSVSGPLVAISSAVTIIDTPVPPPTPTYSVSPSVSTVAEGGTVTFSVSTTNIPTGTTLYWSTFGITGAVTATDFTDGLLTSSFTVGAGGMATIVRTISNDLAGEGTESFQLEIRTASGTGPIVATSSTVTILDGPFPPGTPTYSIAPSTTVVTEGQSVVFTVVTTNVPNGTPLYWSTNLDFVPVQVHTCLDSYKCH